MSIPEVDISNRERSIVVQQIHEAFSTVGFAFITSHNIPKELVSLFFRSASGTTIMFSVDYFKLFLLSLSG